MVTTQTTACLEPQGKNLPPTVDIHCLYSPGEGLLIEELLRFWSLVTFMSLLRLIPQEMF